METINSRFQLKQTNDGSTTLYDANFGECFKSQYAAKTESLAVFIQPGILENPLLASSKPFRILELGFGIGTNFSTLFAMRDSLMHDCPSLEYYSIDHDLTAAKFFIKKKLKVPLHDRFYLMENSFDQALALLNKIKFDVIFYDPFSPKVNPTAWQQHLMKQCHDLLNTNGRLVTYSVSRVAKQALLNTGFHITKQKLPIILHKRESLIGIKI